jgi:hypothetical protein
VADEKVRLFNRTTQPQIPVADIAWGAGVVMPGESFLTAEPEGYAPNQPGSAWVTDEEASAVLSAREAQASVTPDSPAEGATGPQDAAQPYTTETSPTHMLAGAEVVHVEPDGNVVNDAGEIVGHVEQTPPNQAANPQEA